MLATPMIGPALPMGDPLLDVRVLLPRPAGPPVLELPKPDPLVPVPLVPVPLAPVPLVPDPEFGSVEDPELLDDPLLLPNPVPPELLPRPEPVPPLLPKLFPKLDPPLPPKLLPKLDPPPPKLELPLLPNPCPVLLNPEPCCPVVLPDVPVPPAPFAPATPNGWPKNPIGSTFASPR